MIDSKRLLLAAAGLVALAACAKPPPAVDTAKEADAINAEVAAVNAALKAKDADKAVAFDADDIVGWGGGGPPVKSKADDLAANKAAFADPNYSFTLTADHTEVAKSGDIAWGTGSYSETDTSPTTHKVESQSGNWVAGYRKAADGTWKVTAVASAQVAAPPPPATPKT